MFYFDQRNTKEEMLLYRSPEQAVTNEKNTGLIFDSWKSLSLQLKGYTQHLLTNKRQRKICIFFWYAITTINLTFTITWSDKITPYIYPFLSVLLLLCRITCQDIYQRKETERMLTQATLTILPRQQTH